MLDEPEWYVQIDDQFEAELTRMGNYDQDVTPKSEYRLNSSGFFLKLVKHYASTGSASIIMSLGHFNYLRELGMLKGPRGGLRLTYSGLGNQYLRTEAFVELVRSGYVSTRGATTEHLKTLVDATLHRGRSVIAAIQAAVDETTQRNYDPDQPGSPGSNGNRRRGRRPP
ncbi:hypothetical protein [Rhizobium lentis]|uniref:Uncharacterized protein n=1 Tax=Rhizobium lentis TaxID=1138194 RepID=A0A7W8XGN0_9HYPH|nr:hypothetical protein [Rhizobium lentis]MBB4575955.1 hypothetical protein [Rhizobium lentis]MBB5551982.1 hypothetical protein [Rhizobium lentis]MBB5562520.1 hypothetical protein [Rhizobium lentis]MBB5569933.1 hypothetical protein [Rhizobium lentis]